MKSFTKGIIAGVTAGAVFAGFTAFGKEGIESLTAVYRDIKIIVDGTTIDPRDVSGNSVEPFIANGTTYLPVRAVATAFNKQVSWDGDNNMVFLGEQVTNPKKEVELYDKPYLECSNSSSIKMGEEKGVGYIQCKPSSNEKDIANDPDPRYYFDDFVTFATNGVAKTISGDFYVGSSAETEGGVEGILRIYNQNDEELYCSPIMRKANTAEHFEVDVTNEISVKLKFESTSESKYIRTLVIENPVLVTSDY